MSDDKQLTIFDRFSQVVKKKKDQIWNARAPWLKIKPEAFFSSALLNISLRPELIALINTPKGKISLLRCIAEACQMGMMIGGTYAQATIMPIDGQAILVPDAQALIAFCMTAPEVIREIQYRIIYSNHDFIIKSLFGETAEGCIDQKFDYKKHDGNEGEPVGAWAFIIDSNGISKFIYLSKKVVDKFKGNSKSTAWRDWWERMGEKTIIRHILKPYIKRKFVLMNIKGYGVFDMSDELPSMTEEQAGEYQKTNIQERTLNNIPDPPPMEQEQPEKEPEKKQEPAGEKLEQEDLF